DLDNHAILPVVIRDANDYAVAEFPTDPPRKLVVPTRIVAVDDDVARPVTDAGHFQLDRQIRPPAEKAGDPVLEVAAAEDHAVFTWRRNALGPAQQVGHGGGETALGMGGQ